MPKVLDVGDLVRQIQDDKIEASKLRHEGYYITARDIEKRIEMLTAAVGEIMALRRRVNKLEVEVKQRDACILSYARRCEGRDDD